MSESLDIDRIIANNPQIDRSQFEDVKKMIKELRSLGIKPAEYNIESPFQVARRLKSVKEEDRRVMRIKL